MYTCAQRTDVPVRAVSKHGKMPPCELEFIDRITNASYLSARIHTSKIGGLLIGNFDFVRESTFGFHVNRVAVVVT